MAETHYNHGNALLYLSKTRAAMDAYEKSVSLAPDFVPVLLNMGLLYGDLGDHGKAIEILSRGLRESPERVSFHYGLGKNYQAVGDRAAGRRHFRLYLDSGRGRPDVVPHARQRLRELTGKRSETTSDGSER